MTDGPFYPPRAWRERWSDWDADLSRVQRDGRTLRGAEANTWGSKAAWSTPTSASIDGAEVEIWQCDALAALPPPEHRPAAEAVDEAFQGFGATRSEARRAACAFAPSSRCRIPGRTPHIHVKLRHASFGEVTSQLFIAGDPGNARDFLWRSLSPTTGRAGDAPASRQPPTAACAGWCATTSCVPA